MRLLRRHHRRPPEEDPRLVGISFVDVLFALVIAEALAPIKNWSRVPAVGLAHLGLTIVLVITSWIGYHNSRNRPTYFIRFPNLPLGQFLVDIFLVGVYWTTAVSAEGSGNSLGRHLSAVPETITVAASFGLYWVWDQIGFAIRKSDQYGHRKLAFDEPARRTVTSWCLLLALLALVWVLLDEPDSDGHIITVDLLLVGLLLLFRFWKEQAGPARVGVALRRDTAQGLWRAEADDGTQATGSTRADARSRVEASLRAKYGEDCQTYLPRL